MELSRVRQSTHASREIAVSYIAQNFDEGGAFVNTAISLATRLRLRTLFAELEKLEGFPRMEKDFLDEMVADWLSQ